jgi:hypothetical protein
VLARSVRAVPWEQSWSAEVMLRRPSGHYPWFALLAVLVCLSPAAILADEGAIALSGEGGDAWTFAKSVEGKLPNGGCDRILVASPRATVEAWQAEGRFGAVVPLQEGHNEVRAICRRAGADRSVSKPQRWWVRLRDLPRPGCASSPERTGWSWTPAPASRPRRGARASWLTNGAAPRTIRNR